MGYESYGRDLLGTALDRTVIKLYAPTATVLNMNYWTGKGLNLHYWISTTVPGALGGYAIEINDLDENWPAILPVVAGFAGLLSNNKVRVLFAACDPGLLGGRLAPQSFWVHADGTQTET